MLFCLMTVTQMIYDTHYFISKYNEIGITKGNLCNVWKGIRNLSATMNAVFKMQNPKTLLWFWFLTAQLRLISYITSAAQRVFAYECCEDNRREKWNIKSISCRNCYHRNDKPKVYNHKKKQLMKNNLK